MIVSDGVVSRSQPRIAVDEVRRDDLAGAIVEAPLFAAAFLVGLDHDGRNPVGRFALCSTDGGSGVSFASDLLSTRSGDK